MQTPSRSPDSNNAKGSLLRNALLTASVFGVGMGLGKVGTDIKALFNGKDSKEPVVTVPAEAADPALTDAPLWVAPPEEELLDAPLWVPPGQEPLPPVAPKPTSKPSQKPSQKEAAPAPVLDQQEDGIITFGKAYAINISTDAKPDWITFQVDSGGAQVRINGVPYKNQALVGFEVDIKTLKVEKVGQSFKWTGTAWNTTSTSVRSTEDMKELCRQAKLGATIAYKLPDGKDAQWRPVN